MSTFRSYQSKSSTSRRKISSFVLVFLLGLGALVLANFVNQKLGPNRSSAAASTIPLKVIVLYYNDIPANDPHKYTPELKDALEWSSVPHGFKYKRAGKTPPAAGISISIIKSYDFSGGRPKDPTNEATLNTKLILNQQLPGEPAGTSVCSLIDSQQVDMVWTWVNSSDGIHGYEYSIASRLLRDGIYPGFPSNINGTQPTDYCPNAKRSFIYYGFDYKGYLADAVHSFAHSVEALVGNLVDPTLFWGYFTGTLQINGVPFYNVCGNVHFPPNVARDTTAHNAYSYKTDYVIAENYCENWDVDQRATATKVPVNSTSWGSTSIGYFEWWLQNMPNYDSAVTYKGIRVGNWWSLLQDPDTILSKSDYLGYINPILFNDAFKTLGLRSASCSGTSGLSTTCSAGSTLGASTENTNVLAGTSFGSFALVSVLYAAPTNIPNVQVTSVLYCGLPMTRVGTGPAVGGGFKTELWYRVQPTAGTCPVVATFNANPGQRVVAATLLNNIDTVAPVASFTTASFTGTYTSNPSKISITSTGPKDSLMLCDYATYSEQTNPPGPNHVTPGNSTTRNLWIYEDGRMGTQIANVWGGLGAGVQRRSAGESSTLLWNTVKTMGYAASCVNLNVKPFVAVPTPTPNNSPYPTRPPQPIPGSPTPSPTTNPTPVAASVPVVDIKANGVDRLYATKITNFTLSWTTKNAVSCKGLGNWSGTKPVSGSTVVPVPTSGAYYVLQCTSSTGAVWYDRVDFYPTANTTDGKMFVNGFDDTINPVGSGVIGAGTQQKLYLPKGTKPSLTWSIYGITSGGVFAGSCTFGWTKATPTQPAIMAAINVTTTYQMYCQKSTSGTPTTYSTTAFIK